MNRFPDDRPIGQPRNIVMRIVLVIPAIAWFVKVQGALNRHWELHGGATAS